MGEFICILDDDICAIERISSDEAHLGFQLHEAKVDFYSQILKANIVDATSGVMIKITLSYFTTLIKLLRKIK